MIKSFYITLLLLLFSFITLYAQTEPIDTACNCNDKGRKGSRFINLEAARLTILPKFSPLIYKKYEITQNQDIIMTNPALDWVAGVRAYYYAPNSILSVGAELNLIHQKITLFDELMPSFNLQELEIAPYINLKTGDFEKTYHLGFDIGISASIASLSKFAKYYKDSLQNIKSLSILNKNKYNLLMGAGLQVDIFNSNSKKIALFTANILYYYPLKANTFIRNFGETVDLNRYGTYNSTFEYFTFLIGTHININKNKNPYYNVAKKDKKTNAFRSPFYFEEPTKNTYGGLNFGIGYIPNSDTLNTVLQEDSLSYSFRSGYYYQVGYNFHFAGNYEKKGNIKYNFYSGLFINNKNFLLEGNKNERYRILALGIPLGVRIGGGFGYYLTGGISGNYTLLSNNLKANIETKEIDYIDKLSFNWFLGIGLRNIATFSIQKNPIFSSAYLHETNFLNQLEYKITIGF